MLEKDKTRAIRRYLKEKIQRRRSKAGYQNWRKFKFNMKFPPVLFHNEILIYHRLLIRALDGELTWQPVNDYENDLYLRVVRRYGWLSKTPAETYTCRCRWCEKRRQMRYDRNIDQPELDLCENRN